MVYTFFNICSRISNLLFLVSQIAKIKSLVFFYTRSFFDNTFITLHLQQSRPYKAIYVVRIITRWLGWWDSNTRMPESKSGALPLGYSPIY